MPKKLKDAITDLEWAKRIGAPITSCQPNRFKNWKQDYMLAFSKNLGSPHQKDLLLVFFYTLGFLSVGFCELVYDFVEGDSREPSGMLLTGAYHSFVLQASKAAIELPLVHFQGFGYVSGFLWLVSHEVKVNLSIQAFKPETLKRLNHPFLAQMYSILFDVQNREKWAVFERLSLRVILFLLIHIP